MQTICLKRGDTLYLVCSRRVRDVPVNLTDWTVESEIRNQKYEFIHKFDVDVQAPLNQSFILAASPNDTANWPVQELLCDIRYKSPDGSVSTTETFKIRVIHEVTK